MADAFDVDAVEMPREIGGSPVIEELNPGETYLALAGGRRQVVLKRLDPDCLIQEESKLHPHVRDRLRCVREMPHARVANLHGVERDPNWQGGAAYLIWEYVAGEPIDEWIVHDRVKPRDVLAMLRELILTVDSLHARGIVHGAVHVRNVIIDPAGGLRITHVSPLLYTDIQNDIAAIALLLTELAALRADVAEALTQLVNAAGEPQVTLRGLAAHAVLKSEAGEDAGSPKEPTSDPMRRRRMRMAALGVVVIALALSYGLKRLAVARWGTAPVSAPVAPAAALQP